MVTERIALAAGVARCKKQMVAITWMALLVMVAALVAGAYVLVAAFDKKLPKRKSSASGRKCASCGHVTEAAGKYCGRCGKKLD